MTENINNKISETANCIQNNEGHWTGDSELDWIVSRMVLAGIVPDANVQKAIHSLGMTEIKLAFVGKFQVGKSHLANKLFLGGEKLLAEGDGLCTTAVTVKICDGETKRLSVQRQNSNGAVEWSDPTAEDVASVTAACGEEERRELHETVSDVILSYPNDMLKNVIVYDTPGIDDPDPRLLRQTTYSLIPEMDAVCMVVRAQELSMVELQFLQKKVFSLGIGRFIILVSGRPADQLNSSGYDAVLTSIRGQLADIGMKDVPVLLYQEDEDGFPANDTMENIAGEIIQFAQSVSYGNRCSKIKAAIVEQLHGELSRLTLENAMIGKSQAELEQLRLETISQMDRLRRSLDIARGDVEAQVCLLRQNCAASFANDLDGMFRSYIQKLKEADGLGNAQDMLNKIDSTLTPCVENLAVEHLDRFRKAIMKIFEKLRLSEAPTGNATFDGMLGKVSGGFFQNVWDGWITIGDYILNGLLLPGGFIVALGVRWLLGNIPVLKEIMPENLVQGHMANVAAKALENERKILAEDFANQLKDQQNAVLAEMSKRAENELERSKSLLELLSNPPEAINDNQKREQVKNRCDLVISLLEELH